MADLKSTPSTTIYHVAVLEVASAIAEHVVTVSMLGLGGSNSTVVANNLALESRDLFIYLS